MAGKGKPVKSVCRVVHQNGLFAKNSIVMTLNQTRLLLYLLSAFPLEKGAQPLDHVPPIEVKEESLAKVFHFRCSRNNWISQMDEIITAARDISVCKQNGSDLLYFPLFACIMQRDHGDSYLFHLNPMIAPYLTQMLGSCFTAYEFGYALRLKSTYSVRLYDALKEFAYKETFSIPMDDFRVRMGIAVFTESGQLSEVKFPTVKALNQKVLSPAVKEINEKTDLQVSYTLEKGAGRGGPTVGVSFTVTTKEVVNNNFNEFLGIKDGARLAPEADGEAEAILQKALDGEDRAFLSFGSAAPSLA